MDRQLHHQSFGLGVRRSIIPLQSRIKNAVEPDAKEVYETERQLLYVVASVVSDVVAMSDRGGA